MTSDLVYSNTKDQETVKYISRNLKRMEYEHKGAEPFEDYTITIKDNDKILGGAYGAIRLGIMWLEQIYLDESIRHKGYGTKIIGKLQNLGKEKGCDFIIVVTYSFQAPKFYEKQGFKKILELKANNYKVIYYQKVL